MLSPSTIRSTTNDDTALVHMTVTEPTELASKMEPVQLFSLVDERIARRRPHKIAMNDTSTADWIMKMGSFNRVNSLSMPAEERMTG